MSGSDTVGDKAAEPGVPAHAAGEAGEAARIRHDQLIKPTGSLGQLESLGVRLSAITGLCPPPRLDRVHALLFAGDHGVVESGVTPWPSSVTASMVAGILHGVAASSVIAQANGVQLRVIDVGVATALPPHEHFFDRNVRRGTRNLAQEAALTRSEVAAAIEVGRQSVRDARTEGAELIVVGEMGIGNTTPSAAIISALSGESVERCTGRGTGIDDSMLQVKCAVVGRGLARLAGNDDPLAVLAEVGGLEIAAIAGVVLEAAEARVPVVVDGLITLAGLLVAAAIRPGAQESVIASHRPVEPGGAIVLGLLGLDPILDLGLRLGEGGCE